MQPTGKFSKDRSGLILPTGIRERRPPRLLGKGRLKGRIHWELKREGRVIDDGYQDNLITDAGLDNFGLEGNGVMSLAQLDDGNLHTVQRLRFVGAIGEGSATPTVSDTALVSEVMAVNGSDHAFASTPYTVFGGGEEEAVITRQYVFNINANYNLTEFGFRRSSGGFGMSIRELFYELDGVTPRTITLIPNDQLTIYHELTVTYGPVGTNVPASFDLIEYDRDGVQLGITPMSGWATFTGVDNPTRGRLSSFLPGWVAETTSLSGVIVETSTLSGCNPNSVGNHAGPATFSLGAYTGGSHTRRRSIEIPAGSLNQNWYGMRCGFYDYTPYGMGFQFVFDPNSPNPVFTKANTHTFGFAIENSWARA